MSAATLARLTALRSDALAAQAHAETLAAQSAAAVAAAMRDGVTAIAIGEALGVTRSRVYQLARAGGWEATG